jgi:glycosyltransferase involved in cell wall biosynthesis
MKHKILMIGPGGGVIGGIATLVDTLVPVLKQRADLLYFHTVQNRPLEESGKFTLRNFYLVFSQFARFVFVLSTFRPKIIHLHTSQGLAWLKDSLYILMGKAYRCKVVVHVNAADFNELYASGSQVRKFYTRIVMGRADVVIAVSSEWHEYLTQVVPAERVHIIPNCIDVNSFSPRTLLHEDNTTNVLFIGSVGSRKGAFDLIEASSDLIKAQNCSLQVWIAGYSEKEGDLERAFARINELKLGDACQLLGPVYGNKKFDLLTTADLFVLPSYSEGLPLAIIEAMSAGLPIISTPVGGIPDVIRDGYNGFLVPPGDIKALVSKIEILARDPGMRENMGIRSREIAECELDVNHVVKQLVELYDSLATQ